ncbi:MAG: hypothetical protein R3C15_15180 [Thermoleophilia bacterium]
MRKLVLAAAATAALAVAAPAAMAHGKRPKEPRQPTTIALPAGVAPEGIAAGRGGEFFVGSLADGQIVRGDVRSGTVAPFVTTPATTVAVGLEYDRRHDLLFVAGGPTGTAAVYDADTGATVASLTLTTAAAFVNDATVTRDAAYFTNSQAAELYRVPIGDDGTIGTPTTLPLTGPAADLPGAFNLNGIETSKDGRWLIAVNSTSGKLFRIDPATGASSEIDLGGASVTAGDGLWREGRLLYVVRNQLNRIDVFRLDRDSSSARYVETITSPLFEVPTTMTIAKHRLLAVNAQFGLPQPNPFEVVVLPVDDDHGRGHGHRHGKGHGHGHAHR